MKYLVIVESPTKARTISRFLGEEYDIKYSMGHVMDLPKSTLGVEIDNNFLPELEVVADKKKIIAELKAAAKKADAIFLATDPDREGEAIAANIQEVLIDGKKKSGKDFKRVVFHEITKEAIQDAFKQPRSVDSNLVDAQTARRVLDRLVGYQLSPVLWQKVRRGLSAGRVQSVALRMIVEREKEIDKFKKELYWTMHAVLKGRQSEPGVEFDLITIDEAKIEIQESHLLYDGKYTISKTTIGTQQHADEIVSDLEKGAYKVAEVSVKESKRSPYPPYTTSTLQQDASRRLGFPGKRTMSLAQKLYEEGYITYHRTDSVTLSSSAQNQIRSFVKSTYGDRYAPESPRYYATKQKAAQEAHEAIRPTKIQTIDEAKAKVHADLGREFAVLFDLIWRRAIGSQMADAIIESTTVLVDSQHTKKQYRLKTNGSVLLFEGFLKVNPQALQDKRLPKFTSGEDLSLVSARNEKHETPPPPRYNDASLIASLEENGIGRPSTYASIIATLVDRAYVERLEKRLEPTNVGIAVSDFLVKNFSDIDDIPFTAQMEDDLDEIAHGKKEWQKMMKEFYTPFKKQLGEVKNAARVKIEVEKVDELCPECKHNLVIRTGRFGKFLSCSTFPTCKFTKPLVEETKLLCPKDGGKVIVRKTRRGRKFYGCSNYPKCDFAAWKLEDIKGANIKTQNTKAQSKT